LIDLEKLIEPNSLNGFLQNDFGRTWKHFQGDSGRFDYILTQEQLLELIESTELPLPRITVINAGHRLAPELYGEPGSSPNSIKVSAQKITHHLEQGSALLVTHLEELTRPLWDCTEALGQVFQESVTVNAYLGGPNSNGFDLHIDHHDVLVCQLSGEKNWEIRAPSLKHPLVLPDHITEPPQEILWQNTMESGDILYLPRGFWHRAQTEETSSLHLTFGIQPCTGLHFLGWLRKNLLADAQFRADIPRHTPGQSGAYLKELKNILEQIEDPKQLDKFLSEHTTRIESERQQLKAKLYPA
jgi:ribosomal protein L16 Arg81 hydroxylase